MGAAVASPCARVERPAAIEHSEDLQTFDRALLAQVRRARDAVEVVVVSLTRHSFVDEL